MKYLLIFLIGLGFFSIKNNLPILQPIKQTDFKYISSSFGWRSHPIHGDSRFHNGIDIVPQKANTIVFATANGVIQNINYQADKAEGLSILMQHAFGFQTKYAHLQKILVQENESVKAGQAIGIIGATGNATGVHLHYEIRYEGVAVDPVEVRKRLAR